MTGKKTDLAIVNRTFWPRNQVLGEALLQLAERLASSRSVCVIAQSDSDLSDSMDAAGRGKKVRVMACRSFADSSSGLIKRGFEVLYFMLWTMISLVRSRPAKVYVATDPPVLVPFIVFLYCKLFRAEYFYHLQDIHPEAANIVVPLNRFIFGALKAVDNVTMRHANSLVTLCEDMKQYILQRSGTKVPIFLLDNPSFYVEGLAEGARSQDVVFCGNAGRLQRIPMLLAAIRSYLDQGGRLSFTFVGAGLYGPKLQELANIYDGVTYLGYLPAEEAAAIVGQHRWALLPIEDEVTRYAFPSKSSSYVVSGCGVLAICGEQTSVARWVHQYNVGITCKPEHEALIAGFHEIEKANVGDSCTRGDLLHKLEIGYFVQRLCDLLGFRLNV